MDSIQVSLSVFCDYDYDYSDSVQRGMILEQVSHSLLLKNDILSSVFSMLFCQFEIVTWNAVICTVSDSIVLRLEMKHRVSRYLGLLVNNPAVCVVQMRRYVVSRVGSDPLRRYPGCCSTPIDVRSLPPSSAFLWSNFGLLSTGFPQFVAENIISDHSLHYECR